MSEYVQVSPAERPPELARATTFNAAAEELQKLIDWAKENEHRVGYFAAVYKRITLALKQATEADAFEDSARMALLAGTFASRYIDAVNRHFQPGRPPPSRSWQASFARLDKPRPIIVQHLQAGINAHTLFDLGMSVNTICDGHDLDRVRNDFLAVNAVLAGQADDMLDNVEEISPLLKVALNAIPGDEARLIGPAIKWMREDAWYFAKTLELTIDNLDFIPSDIRDTAVAGLTAATFHGLAAVAVDVIAEQESRDVARNIEVLDGLANEVSPIQLFLD